MILFFRFTLQLIYIDFMRIHYTLILIFIFLFLNSFAQYREDELGYGLVCRTIEMPDDYEGKVICTLIKRECSEPSQKAVLYVHGFNDYFFQTEMADRFNKEGYNFYAIDLRKYGRSLLPHQKRCNVRDMSEYFADLDSAVNIMRCEGNTSIVLMGHSTGGLTTSLYCHSKGDDCPVDALILNSPFFKFNMGTILNDYVIPVVAAIAPVIPTIDIPQGASTAYAESLLKNYHGEWVFDTNKKLMLSPDVTTDWISAIYNGQKKVWEGLNIKIPVLAMYSNESVDGDVWSEEFMHGDAVLNVKDIAEYAQKLGDNVQRAKIVGGIHDLLCSLPDVRERAYRYIFYFLMLNTNN